MKLSIETIMPNMAMKNKKVIIKVDLKGSLDNNNAPEFNFIMNTLINGGGNKLILDIDGLQYIDSTGIGSLITLTKKIRNEKGDIAITRFTSQILTMLKPINLDKFIHFFPTIEEGINYLKSIKGQDNSK